MMASFSETRDERIGEYHVVNSNPVVGLEEGALVRWQSGRLTALGTARVKLFKPNREPKWFHPGRAIPLR